MSSKIFLRIRRRQLADYGVTSSLHPVFSSSLATRVRAEMAAPDESRPIGPDQRGRNKPGQYVYLLVFSHPEPGTVERLGLKTPASLSKTEFRDLALECHTAAGVDLVETACFRELRSNGLPHLNLLVRARAQYRWKQVGEELRRRSVRVDFAPNDRLLPIFSATFAVSKGSRRSVSNL